MTTPDNRNPYVYPSTSLYSGAAVPTSPKQKDQILTCVDIISEGPISGLPFGRGSIYLDNSVVADKEHSAVALQNTAAGFVFNGSTTVATNDIPADSPVTDWDPSTGSFGRRWLIIRAFHTETVTATKDGVTQPDDWSKVKLTTGSAFFNDAMIFDGLASDQQYVIVELKQSGTSKLYGFIMSRDSGTVAYLRPITVDYYTPSNWANGTYDMTVSANLEIEKIASGVITLKSGVATPGSVGNEVTLAGDISDSVHSHGSTVVVPPNQVSNVTKVEDFDYAFTNGTRTQPPLDDGLAGIGGTSITVELNTPFTYPDQGTTWPQTEDIGDAEEGETLEDAAPIEKNITQLGLSSATAREVDELRFVFNYPAGLNSKGNGDEGSGGSFYNALAVYLIEISIDRGDGEGFRAYKNFRDDNDYYYHHGATESSFYIQENLSLVKEQPFVDFKIRFTRASRDDKGPTSSFGYDQNNTVVLASVLQSCTSVIRNRFNYPYTAHAVIKCNAKEFQNIPKRSYECKGRLIQVPSNYVTRDEAAGGVANYKRNSGGGIVSTEQDWDGNFRNHIYTDNPAWVFYDIIINNRYGLGTWIEATDIDKYALYRIARYCDELVPDGKGGQEPRFVANIYLTKATEAYKVLKDMATTFRSILYWTEGNVLPVIDQAKDPVYNFTKGNVIEGKFQYESTSSRVRSNQIAVTWNNPDNNYTPEALLVEDRENIVKTGKIIIEEAVAFGATSIGQATRYGRWKLWTAINQHEIVSFKTSISGAFLGPGDIINIQDADRHDVSYSGRISTTGTFNTTTIPLDRTVVINAGSVYELSIVIQEPAAFLGQDSATISVGGTNTDYVRGDILSSTLYTNETNAADIQDTSGNLVQVIWAPHTHIESHTVNGATGNRNPLTVSTGFNAFSTSAGQIAHREAIWLLKETVTSTGLEREGSKKMYKILGIREDKKNELSISAVEHFNEKFDAVDKDFGRPYVDTILEPKVEVPPPTNLRAIIYDT